MRFIKSRFFPYLIILAAILIYYLPILIKPALILNRGNDLQEFFWPIYYYVKQQIISNHQIPLWNNSILSGTPLLPDPQAPIFYPLNIFALLLPLDSFFIFSFILHSFIGAIGIYFCSNHGYRFSKTSSIILALLYITTPKLAGYLEAGHVGLINSMAWVPFILYATIKLSNKPSLKHSIILALSLSLLFYSHLPTFLIIAISSGAFLIIKSLLNTKAPLKKLLAYFLIAGAFSFGLVAISLLPQIEWQKNSTRYLLLRDKDVYPKWQSVFEIPKNVLIPWIDGAGSMQKIDSEKWISIGIIPFLLAFYGFLKVKRKIKMLLLTSTISIFLVVSNNASPIYPILLKQNWYLLLRVSTRFWILIILMVFYLVGISYENMLKSKSQIILYITLFLAVAESLFLSWSYLSKPINNNAAYAPKEIYEYLSRDKSLFRVFCLTRCLSQQTAAIYNLQLMDGYNTIQQKNYYQQAWQLTGTYWNYYTLSIPPVGSYTFSQLRPDAKSLGEYNVKYIISPYQLKDKNFILKRKIENYYVYENKLLQPRANTPIIFYSPNKIRIDTSSFRENQVILAEVYSTGWKAYLDGSKEVPVLETPVALRAIDITPNTKYINLIYKPTGYKIGLYITLTTILLLAGYGIYKWKNLKR